MMMRYAFFKGCKMPSFLTEYERTTRLVLKKLDVELVDLEFNCCGHQVRDQDHFSFVFAAIRNIALAEAKGLTIMTPCKCCFGNLMSARHAMAQDDSLRNAVNEALAAEGLGYSGEKTPRHLLSLLRHEIGPEAIQKHVVNDLKDKKIAAHYGCHALRPSTVMQFDNPLAPVLFEELIQTTGATPVEWSRRLECCGNPILEKNRALSVKMMTAKLDDAAASGADTLCTACSYCQIQFDHVRTEEKICSDAPPAVPFTTLLAEAFGLK